MSHWTDSSGDAPRFTGRACPERRAALRGIADGHATLASVESTREHAAECGRCAAELRVAERLRRMLDGLVAPESTRADEEAFVASVLGRLDAAPAPEAPRRRPVARPVAIGAAAALTAAAALAITALGGGRPPAGGSTEREAPEVDSFAAGDATKADAVTAQAPSMSGATPGPDAPTIDLGPGARPVDMAEFEAAVAEARDATEFDAAATEDAARFLAALEVGVSGDPRRAARHVLRQHVPSDLDGVAARVLGPAPDLQDRALLERTLGRTGTAGLRATAERGAAGVEAVWRIASADDALGAEARALLASLTIGDAGPGPLDHVPPGTPADAIIAVASAAPVDPAHLLGRWLDTGEAVWLDLFGRAPASGDALAALLARRRALRVDDRLLAALRRCPVPDGVDATMDALRGGLPDAAGTLARLADVGGAEALIGATRSGVLRTRAEDGAWTAMIAASPRAVLAAAESEGDLEVALESLARSAGATGLGPAGLDLALTCAEDPDRAARFRELALMVIASTESEPPDDVADARGRAADLREDPSVDVAASAWLAWLRLGGVPDTTHPEVARALARGGSPSVARLRVARALSRARSGSGSPD